MKGTSVKKTSPQEYNHTKVEAKWQKKWEKEKAFEAVDSSKKPKFYSLIEFPYPSGEGLHVGHIRSNTAMDVISRKRRAEGYNVLYPVGWDSFGLPTENYAIKTGIHPKIVTKKNTDNFRRQLKAIGFSFDWSRELDTSDPAYYKWTQWIFLQFLKKGLAYKKKMAVNWCPKDLTVLANEEVIDGACERCGTLVEKREKEQWMLAITKYADRLDRDLDTVDFQEKIKIQQRNWIGRSEGVNFKCTIKDLGIHVEMFNSVPQTYLAETFTVIAPEHPLVEKLVAGTPKEKEVLDFVKRIKDKKAKNTFETEKEIEGIFTGRYIENYANTGKDLPIWVASYVVMEYGTGIVNCSAHDERDVRFAKKYAIPLHEVMAPLIEVKSGEFAFQPNKKTVPRKCILAIIKKKNKDEYLVMSSKKFGWKTYVIGGIEEGEDPLKAAKREIQEETGYMNPRFVKDLGIVCAKHFAPHKDENRFAELQGFYFELDNEEQGTVADAEKSAQEVIWVKKDEMEKTLYPKITDWEFWKRLHGEALPAIGAGILIEPAEFRGREWAEVREDIISYLDKKGIAKRAVNYKLRDWVFSRQRYWGEPIPVIHCEKCGIVPVPEKDLPVKLPEVKNYKPTENGESPLASVEKWVNVKCPECKSPAKRETDTMPNWAGSSWYFLRYIDPQNKKEFASPQQLQKWLPVDWYNGGMEHTTLHLLYSRFWHKFLFDQGLVPTNEPYHKRTSHGLILAEGGVKMSKSKGNVVNPDELIERMGADTLRVYEMFMGPFGEAIAWSTDNMVGSRRFLERVWKLSSKISEGADEATVESEVQKTIRKVSEDIETMKFNTAVSQLMILLNEFEKGTLVSQKHYEVLLKLLSPFAPHITEELYSLLGNKKSIHDVPWPVHIPEKEVKASVQFVVQVNGKVRGTFTAAPGSRKEDLEKTALTIPSVSTWISGKTIAKIIYVPDKLFNIVVQ
jgi:leucyl-tRNA synthetase